METKRLLLRPFELYDAPAVQGLAGDKSISDTTLNIPHPYKDGMAEEWIAAHQDEFDSRQGVTFAITHRTGGSLVGAISLMNIDVHRHAELGYWIGKPFWGDGFCTEAAQAVLSYAFTELCLIRIHAQHMSRNPASGRVMQKLGMLHEGTRKRDSQKGDRIENMELYGIMKEEWTSMSRRKENSSI